MFRSSFSSVAIAGLFYWVELPTLYDILFAFLLLPFRGGGPGGGGALAPGTTSFLGLFGGGPRNTALICSGSFFGGPFWDGCPGPTSPGGSPAPGCRVVENRVGGGGGSRTMLICVFCRAFGFHHGVEDEFRFQGGVGVCRRV